MQETTRHKGQRAEDLAAAYLETNGYTVIERNWRAGRAEIDIIAREGQTLVVVEVKSRSYTSMGYPEEGVSKHKENLLADAAGRYMELHNHHWEVRFDIISIVLKRDDTFGLNHYKDAFFPGME